MAGFHHIPHEYLEKTSYCLRLPKALIKDLTVQRGAVRKGKHHPSVVWLKGRKVSTDLREKRQRIWKSSEQTEKGDKWTWLGLSVKEERMTRQRTRNSKSKDVRRAELEGG